MDNDRCNDLTTTPIKPNQTTFIDPQGRIKHGSKSANGKKTRSEDFGLADGNELAKYLQLLMKSLSKQNDGPISRQIEQSNECRYNFCQGNYQPLRD